MSFERLSPLLVAAGAAALLAGLFLLQRIRVRHRRLEVVTTLFWREAVEETRARVLVRRFRHPYAYLLFSLIALLLWFAFSDPSSRSEREVEHILLLDASGASIATGEWDRAREAAVAWAEGRSPLRRRVILCGARPETVLGEGEAVPVLKRRLEAESPQAAPPSIDHVLRQILRTAATGPRRIAVLGGRALDALAAPEAPRGTTVERIRAEQPAGGANIRIEALGIGESSSNLYGSVDVFVRVSGPGATVAASLDGVPVAPAATGGGPDGAYLFRDLPGSGGEFRVQAAPADDRPLDNEGRLALPVRRVLPVYVDDALLPLAGPVVLADPGLALAGSDAAAVLVLSAPDPAEIRPQLAATPARSQEETFLLHHPEGEDSGAVLLAALRRLGIGRIDTAALAEELGAPVTLGALPSPVRMLTYWREVLEEDCDFRHSRSFPLFFAMGIRWLAGIDEPPAESAAGRPLGGDGNTLPADAEPEAFAALRAPLRAGPGGGTAASLLPFDGAVDATGGEPLPSAPDGAGPRLDWSTWLLAAGLLCLMIEWFLFRSGRIP